MSLKSSTKRASKHEMLELRSAHHVQQAAGKDSTATFAGDVSVHSAAHTSLSVGFCSPWAPHSRRFPLKRVDLRALGRAGTSPSWCLTNIGAECAQRTRFCCRHRTSHVDVALRIMATTTRTPLAVAVLCAAMVLLPHARAVAPVFAPFEESAAHKKPLHVRPCTVGPVSHHHSAPSAPPIARAVLVLFGPPCLDLCCVMSLRGV